jgi:hypothetical protein
LRLFSTGVHLLFPGRQSYTPNRVRTLKEPYDGFLRNNASGRGQAVCR